MSLRKKNAFTLRAKLFIGMAALMLTTIIAIGASSYTNAADIARSRWMVAMESALNGVANDLNNRLSLAMETGERIAWSGDVRTILSKPVNGYTFSEQFADFQVLERIVAVLSHDVYLYIDSDTMISRERTRFFSLDTLNPSDQLTENKNQRAGWWVRLPIKKLNPTIDYSSIAYLSNVRNEDNVFDVVGVVAVALPENDLIALLNAVTLTANTKIAITDDMGNVVLQSEEGGGSAPFHTITQALPATGWHIAANIPMSDLTEPLSEIMRFYLLLSVAVLAVVLGLSLGLATSITRRLSQLAALMKSQGGTEDIKLSPVQTMDEVGVLQSTYNEMLTDRKRLIEQLYIGAIRQRDAELKALEAQINPHFLYNTLDTMNWMALEAGAVNVSDMITSLARFFRFSLRKTDGPITVEEDLEHARLYLELQKKRMRDSLIYSIDVPESVRKLCMLKLTIQPLVENAIIHGIERNENQSGAIRITGWTQKDCACLCVEDDGPGFDDTKGATGLEEKLVGYGLCLTDQRIKLAYGDAYGLHFGRSGLGGAKVIIRLPLPSNQ